MRFFDTDIQILKNRVLTEVAELAFEDKLTPENTLALAEKIIPEGEATMRCCIYKERAIINQRVQLALGGNPEKKTIVEVLPIACDECPVEGILVTQACRGCLAHRCMNACPKGAIHMENHHAVVDKSKCIECGRCVDACNYSALVKQTRPCVRACKTKAISMNPDNGKANINEEKCINCGACVYQCPFGAISDKSFITQVIKLLRESENNTAYHVYAVVAPALGGQYTEIDIRRVLTGIKQLGFYDIVEAAWGADFVTYHEAKELVEKKFLTSSCCPAFVAFIEKNYPTLKDNISHNLSPMAYTAKMLREKDPLAKCVFIGPCIAKKNESLNGRAKDHVECSITFEELHALLMAKGIDLENCELFDTSRSSYYGRAFARSGGLANAVTEMLKELNIAEEEFKLKAIACSGISECNVALLKAKAGKLPENFIEGMACEHGCIGGPACLSHTAKTNPTLAKYEKHENERTILDAIAIEYEVK